MGITLGFCLAWGEWEMTVHKIVTYGNAALRRKAKAVKVVDDGIRALAKEMLKVMYAENGLGLAAEQVGRDEAICVIDVPAEQAEGALMPMVLINPEITVLEGEQVGQEGCLSFPGVFINVKRAEKATVCFLNLEGRQETVATRGLVARAVQHELDHLNGVLLVDHMTAVQKVANAGKLKRLRKEGRAEG